MEDKNECAVEKRFTGNTQIFVNVNEMNGKNRDKSAWNKLSFCI